jgi:hypothetical protein
VPALAAWPNHQNISILWLCFAIRKKKNVEEAIKLLQRKKCS